jgi:hypothetical protein
VPLTIQEIKEEHEGILNDKEISRGNYEKK